MVESIQASRLPPIPRLFVGRDLVREELLSVTRSRRVVFLVGPGGSGKSALLAGLAQQLSRRHKTALLRLPPVPSVEEFWSWLRVNLGLPLFRGTPDGILPSQVVHAIERSRIVVLLDGGHRLPHAVISDLVASALAGIRLGRLVIASQEPPPVLATERDEVATIRVDGLAEEEAQELLARTGRAGRRALDRARRAHLHRLLGGNPLGLRLAAVHPHLVEPKVVVRDRLDTDRALDLEIVEPVLEGLPSDRWEALSLAAFAGGVLPAEVAQALRIRHSTIDALAEIELGTVVHGDLHLSDTVVEATLRRLGRPSRTEGDAPGVDSRALHLRLAQAHERCWQGHRSRLAWLLAAVDLYFASGEHERAAVLLASGRDSALEAVPREYLARLAQLPVAADPARRRLDLDRAHLTMVFNGPNALSRAILTRLLEGADGPVRPDPAAAVEMADLEWLEGHLDEARSWCDQALEADRGARSRDVLPRILVRIGAIESVSGNLAGAKTAFRRAVDALRRGPDRVSLSRALAGQAQVLEAQGDLAGAIEHYRKAHRLQRDARQPGLSGATLERLGLCLAERGLYRQALACLRRAGEDLRTFGDRVAAAQVDIHQAVVHATMGSFASARPLFYDSLETLRELGTEAMFAQGLLASGLADLDSGDLAGAARAMEEASDIFERLADERRAVGVQIAQAQLMRATGNLGGAKVLLEGLLVEAHRHRWDPEGAEILLRLASLALEEGDLETARHRANEAIASFEAQGRHRTTEKVRALLVRVAFLDGDLRTAHEMAGQELGDARARRDAKGLAMTLAQLAEVRLAQGRPADALRHAKEALRLRQRSGDVRGLASGFRLLAEIHLQRGSLAEARRTVSRGMEIARLCRSASERAYLLLIQGALMLREGRATEAGRIAEQLGREAAGVLELQLLALKLGQTAYGRTNQAALSSRSGSEWAERLAGLPASRARRLERVAIALGLERGGRPDRERPSLAPCQRRIVNLLSQMGGLSSHAIADHLGLASGRVRRELSRLVEAGLVRRTGRGRAVLYVPARREIM